VNYRVSRQTNQCVTRRNIHTQTTDTSLVQLEQLTSLETLELSGTQITDAGLVHLKGLARLQALVLGNTQITDAGVDTLQKTLPKCRIIQLPLRRIHDSRLYKNQKQSLYKYLFEPKFVPDHLFYSKTLY